MYRLVILLAIITVSESCQCHWGSRAPIDDYFLKVANKVIEADRKLKSSCASQGTGIQEVYGDTDYKYVLKITPGANTDFVLKVRNRVLFIQGNGSCRSISQIKILPELLNYQQASWQLQDDELVVTVPYVGDNGDLKQCLAPDYAERILPNICKQEIF